LYEMLTGKDFLKFKNDHDFINKIVSNKYRPSLTILRAQPAL